MSAELIRLSVVIMTHPVRRPLAEKLAADHPELTATIVCDPVPDGPPGSFRTARAAWAAVPPGATHHLVLQDDVELCAGFVPAVHSVIATRPGAAISLFTEWGSRTSHGLRIAALTRRSWARVTDTYVPTQGLVLTADTARGAEQHLARAQAAALPDDQALLEYLDDRAVDCFAFLPNLLEHRDVTSIVGNTEMGRRPSVCYFAGGPTPDEFALLGDPEPSAVTDCIPYFSWTDATAYFCVRDAASGSWRRVPAADVFAERGVSRRALLDAFTDAVQSAAGPPELRETVSPVLLHQMWLTAAGHGLRIAEATGDDTPPSITSRVARQAIGTLTPGGLRRFLPPAHLSLLPGRMGSLVEAAMRYGAAVAGSPAPVRAAPAAVTP